MKKIVAVVLGTVAVLVTLAALTPTFLEHATGDLDDLRTNLSEANITTRPSCSGPWDCDPGEACYGLGCTLAPVLFILAVVVVLGLVFRAWAILSNRIRGGGDP